MNAPSKLEFVRRIGAGGMAETLECLRTSPGGLTTRVCVKRMLPSHREDPELVRLFEREARLSLQLSHGSIARAIETLVDESGPALVLEYVDGVDLRALLRSRAGTRERIDVDLALLVVQETALALHHAHTLSTERIPNGLVHRDISPSNILLGLEGDVKLVDFGIAKAVGDPHHTTTGVIRGKIPYMAPEYARTGHYDVRSDLFSLGVVAYELLTLRRPYQGENDPETLERAASGRRPSLTSLRSDVPLALARVVEALLSPRPEERPAAAREVLEALEGHGGKVTARAELSRLVRALSEPPAPETDEGPTRSMAPLETTVPIGAAPESAPPLETEPLPPASTTRPLAGAQPQPGSGRALPIAIVILGVALSAATWLALTQP